MTIAAGVQTSMDLGAGFVDVLRFGEGMSEGGLGGVGVQFRLNALGFGAGPVDGIKGPKTTNAVRSSQKAYPPLKIDGIPGPRTQEKLVEICGF